MECPRCRAGVPDVAHFCQICGQDLRSADTARRRSFAARPDEPVASFALISSIMPRGTGRQPQTYRIALAIALLAAVVAAAFGALPIAVLIAAFAVPVVYVVYLYDVNLWEDEPLPVTGLAFGLTALLALGFTLLWTTFTPVGLAVSTDDGLRLGGPSVIGFLIVALLVPVVGEILRQIGPVLLTSRPEFDDLMDGLTFGVVSGVAYAAFDTIVRHWVLLTGGIAEQDPGQWVSLILLEGFVKPLIMGTATGLACAEFSGLGKGYDGFTPRYFVAVATAMLANVAYSAGGYLFSFVDNTAVGLLLQIVWGLIILGALLLRVRTVLHTGLMEAALEESARSGSAGPAGELGFCAYCEMPLLDRAAFCNACGTAVRTQAKPHRVNVAAPAGAPVAGPEPVARPEPAAAPEPARPAPEATTTGTTTAGATAAPEPDAQFFDQEAEAPPPARTEDEEGRS